MADINVERRRPSLWPWIIGLIILALIVWALSEMFGGDLDSVPAGTRPDTLLIDTMTTTPP